MKPQVIRLNEAALLAAGLDIVSVKALSEIVRVAGPVSGGSTIPETVKKTDEVVALAEVLREQVGILQDVIETLEMQPDAAPPDLSGIAALAAVPAVQVYQQIEHLTTEVRENAEQIAVLTRQLDELKLGMNP